MKYKCVKSKCQVCGKVSLIQLFFRSNGQLSYGRARHYLGQREGKPQFEYHPQSMETLKDLLKTQTISLTTEKAKDGQVGQAENSDLIKPENSLNQQKACGRRLVWFRTLAFQAQKNFDPEKYKQYLFSKYSHVYAEIQFNYLLKYPQCYDNPSELLSVPVTIRSNVLKSMITLSKYLGNYEAYKSAIKNHGIKWANNNDSLTAFVRILNGNNLKGLSEWYQQAMAIFSPNEKLYLRLLALSGVRKTEAKMVYDKIREMATSGRLEEYYNRETLMLEHFRHKQFLRGTKNLYVSAIPFELIQKIAKTEDTISLASMRKKLIRNKLPQRFKELRQFYATNMRKLCLMQELISLLQGRVERTVFTQFYLKENPRGLSNKTISLLEKFEKNLQNCLLEL